MFGKRKPTAAASSRIVTPGTACEAGCGGTVTSTCAYTDRRNEFCGTGWCARHTAVIDGVAYCRRHAGVVRAMEKSEAGPSQRPEVYNRAPSLCEWVANELDGGIRAIMIMTQRVHPGTSIGTRPLHCVLNGMPRRPMWYRSWMLQDHTGTQLHISVEVDEARETEVVVRVDSIEVERFIPPWIKERGSGDPGLIAQRRHYFRSRILQSVAEASVRRSTVGQIGEVMQKLATTEERAKEAAERSRAVLDNVADGIITFDENAVIESSNPSARRILGYLDHELAGQPVSLILGAEAHAELLAQLGPRSWQEPDPKHGHPREWIGRRSDGTTFEMECLISDMQVGSRHLFVGTFRDISDRKAQIQAIAHLAMHDALTGLPNRTLFSDRLKKMLEECRRTGRSAGVLLIDLNRFKEVNDALGHQAGDILLQELAARLRGVLREADTVARLGGDEFAILPGGITDVESALDTARRVLAVFDKPVVLEGTVVEVNASIGVAMFPEHGMTPDELVRHADVAMYVAKRGRTGCALYSPDQDDHSPSRLGLMGELRRGIANGELRLRYQPQVELTTGRMVGVEALVRWEHPREGLLSPDSFIAAAEESGPIEQLTEWVLDEALRQQRAWVDSGLDIGVAVNLSARNLHQQDLSKMVGRLVAARGVQPERLTLEITETILMAPSAKHLLNELKTQGYRISIDDFGTGYSSLAYLRGLPLAEMKIDRSFVQNLASSEDDAAIVRSTIELAHSLGLEVVAEGVSDIEGRAALLLYGCDYVQCHLLSLPLTAEEVEKWEPEPVWRPRLQLVEHGARGRPLKVRSLAGPAPRDATVLVEPMETVHALGGSA
ncbi:MAG TPA: EAL domain-containing protein [Candidatus Dormibacteraeota bacterium]|nr:EAL domain-containing protein [Candidatus Dormibacteraeota bacterium]